ncbi:MAG: diaminopropionate ammonia-lyase [Candidatus Zixiibacteriota bacterium]|nr:MAG: diaminopropionate ammonia-lyase [candidate division Zixibacteria bacterium]
MCDYSLNRHVTDNPVWSDPEYTAFLSEDIEEFHRSVPGYSFTPLVRLSCLARKIGVREILVKDESHRFGLKAFKSMGASYAIYRFIKRVWENRFGVKFEIANLYDPALLAQIDLRPFCTATDGNHGRAVAWFANKIGQRAVIYIPSCAVKARIDNIRKEGAEVVVVDGSYDQTLKRMAQDAEEQGWHVISDTSYPGYTEVSAWIMAAYTTMFREIDRALDDSAETPPSHAIFQVGVGSFAGAAAWYYLQKRNPPLLIGVEPTEADCILESIRHGDGELRSSRGSLRTIMAGLNCGTPSLNAWPLIRDGFRLAVAISDESCRKAMRQFYHPVGDDPRVISGESGAAGLAALIALATAEKLAEAKERLEIGSDSTILVFNTEGDTDPEHFREVTGATD